MKRFILALFLIAHIPLFGSSNELMVGLGDHEIFPPEGTPLSGYGGLGRRFWTLYDWTFRSPFATWFKPAKGNLDTIRSKVMIIKKGERLLLFLSVDVVGVPASLGNEIYDEIAHLGFRRRDVYITATHSHAGPGAMAKNKLLSLIAVDKFKQEVYDVVFEKIIEAIHIAYENLRPAELLATNFQAKNLQKNRSGKEGHFDPTVNMILARATNGEWLGGIINFAIHGTALNMYNLRFSADVPGTIERHFENYLSSKNAGTRPIMLFINGAEGDVAPQVDGLSWKEWYVMEHAGRVFNSQAIPAMKNLSKVAPTWKTSVVRVDLGPPKMFLGACIGSKFVFKMIKKVGLKLRKWFPQVTEINLLQLGNLNIFTWPGEPTTSLGFALKKIAYEAGLEHPMIFSLTNDHLLYFTTPEEYWAANYESCSTIYGADGGNKILWAYKRLIDNLKK